MLPISFSFRYKGNYSGKCKQAVHSSNTGNRNCTCVWVENYQITNEDNGYRFVLLTFGFTLLIHMPDHLVMPLRMEASYPEDTTFRGEVPFCLR